MMSILLASLNSDSTMKRIIRLSGLASLRAGHAHVEDLDQVAAPTLIAWAELDRILPLRGRCVAWRSSATASFADSATVR